MFKVGLVTATATILSISCLPVKKRQTDASLPLGNSRSGHTTEILLGLDSGVPPESTPILSESPTSEPSSTAPSQSTSSSDPLASPTPATQLATNCIERLNLAGDEPTDRLAASKEEALLYRLIDLLRTFEKSGKSPEAYFADMPMEQFVEIWSQVNQTLKLPVIKGPFRRPSHTFDLFGKVEPRPLILELSESGDLLRLRDILIKKVQKQYARLCTADLERPSAVLLGRVPVDRLQTLEYPEVLFYALGCREIISYYDGAQTTAAEAFARSELLALVTKDITSSTWDPRAILPALSTADETELAFSVARIEGTALATWINDFLGDKPREDQINALITTSGSIRSLSTSLTCRQSRLLGKQKIIAVLSDLQTQMQAAMSNDDGETYGRLKSQLRMASSGSSMTSATGFRLATSLGAPQDATSAEMLKSVCDKIETAEALMTLKLLRMMTELERKHWVKQLGTADAVDRVIELTAGTQDLAQIAEFLRGLRAQDQASKALDILKNHFEYVREVLKFDVAIDSQGSVVLLPKATMLDLATLRRASVDSWNTALGISGIEDPERSSAIDFNDWILMPPRVIGDKLQIELMPRVVFERLRRVFEEGATDLNSILGIALSRGNLIANPTPKTVAIQDLTGRDNLKALLNGLQVNLHDQLVNPDRRTMIALTIPGASVVFLPPKNGSFQVVTKQHLEEASRMYLDSFNKVLIDYQKYVEANSIFERTVGFIRDAATIEQYQAKILDFSNKLSKIEFAMRTELGLTATQTKPLNDIILKLLEDGAVAAYTSSWLMLAAPVAIVPAVYSVPSTALLGVVAGVTVVTIDHYIGSIIDGKEAELTTNKLLAAGALGAILGPLTRVPIMGKLVIGGLAFNSSLVAASEFGQRNFGSGVFQVALTGLALKSLFARPSGSSGNDLAELPATTFASRTQTMEFFCGFPVGFNFKVLAPATNNYLAKGRVVKVNQMSSSPAIAAVGGSAPSPTNQPNPFASYVGGFIVPGKTGLCGPATKVTVGDILGVSSRNLSVTASAEPMTVPEGKWEKNWYIVQDNKGNWFAISEDGKVYEFVEGKWREYYVHNHQWFWASTFASPQRQLVAIRDQFGGGKLADFTRTITNTVGMSSADLGKAAAFLSDQEFQTRRNLVLAIIRRKVNGGVSGISDVLGPMKCLTSKQSANQCGFSSAMLLDALEGVAKRHGVEIIPHQFNKLFGAQSHQHVALYVPIEKGKRGVILDVTFMQFGRLPFLVGRTPGFWERYHLVKALTPINGDKTPVGYLQKTAIGQLYLAQLRNFGYAMVDAAVLKELSQALNTNFHDGTISLGRIPTVEELETTTLPRLLGPAGATLNDELFEFDTGVFEINFGELMRSLTSSSPPTP